MAMFMPTRLKVLVSSESTSDSQIKVGHPRPIADESPGRDDEESQDGRLVSHHMHVDWKFCVCHCKLIAMSRTKPEESRENKVESPSAL